MVHFNFREDRAREITKALCVDNFNADQISFSKVKNVYFVSMTEYEKDLTSHVIYKQELVEKTLTEILSGRGLSILKVAETEKYAHVTYFLNGLKEDPYEKEARILIPSLRIPTYDLKPEMRIREITDNIIDK